MRISDEEVEAAARAMHAESYPAEYWDSRPDLRHVFTERATTALKAAAPHMLARAWDEAIAAATKRQDDIEYAIYTGQTIPDDPISNPYRSQA